MVIKKGKFKVSNKIGYDIVHLETSASQVFANDGEDLESKISHYVKKEDLRIVETIKSCYPSSLDYELVPGTGQYVYKTYIIDNELDDGYVSINGVDNTSTELLCSPDPKSSVLFKWNNINIPQGSYIYAASIIYYFKDTTDTHNLNILANFSKEDNATMPTTLEEFESKTWTENNDYNKNSTYISSSIYNLGDFFNEIISRPGWESGNSILSLITTKDNDKIINSYKLGSEYAAKLQITYEDINTRRYEIMKVKIPLDGFDKTKHLMSVYYESYYGTILSRKNFDYTISNDSKYIHLTNYTRIHTKFVFKFTYIKGDSIEDPIGGDNSDN